MTALSMRVGQRRPSKPLTLGDHVRLGRDLLEQLQPHADNDRRPHRVTETVLDDLDAIGSYLKRVARGGTPERPETNHGDR